MGDTIDVIVTASNADGSSSATAAYLGPVTSGSGGSSPSNTVAPYFVASTGDQACTNGCAIVGETLRATPGTWTCNGGCGTLIYTYQWQACKTTTGQPPTTGSCSDATGAGATTARYTVAAGDVGKSLVPIVTAHNNGTPSTPTTIAGSRCSTGEIPYLNPDDAYNNAARTPRSAGCGGWLLADQRPGRNHPGERTVLLERSDNMRLWRSPGWKRRSATRDDAYIDRVARFGHRACTSLGSPGWCSGSGTSGNPWVVNAVSASSVKVSGSGYWTVENSHISEATSDCVVCVGGGPLTMLDDTVAGVDNTTNEAAFGVYNDSTTVTGNVTMNGVYFYNGEGSWRTRVWSRTASATRTAARPGPISNCHHGCPGPTRGFVSTNNV